jgi:hypothetical protein
MFGLIIILIDYLTKSITLDGSTLYNIFKVTGSIRLIGLYSYVTTQIANTSSTLYVRAYSTNGIADLTDAPGSNIQNLPVGATLVRSGPVTSVISIANPTSGPAIIENASYRNPETTVNVVSDINADTYIQIILSNPVASGVMKWHCRYEPLSDNGYLEVV